jgi:hypothetical protein
LALGTQTNSEVTMIAASSSNSGRMLPSIWLAASVFGLVLLALVGDIAPGTSLVAATATIAASARRRDPLTYT